MLRGGRRGLECRPPQGRFGHPWREHGQPTGAWPTSMGRRVGPRPRSPWGRSKPFACLASGCWECENPHRALQEGTSSSPSRSSTRARSTWRCRWWGRGCRWEEGAGGAWSQLAPRCRTPSASSTRLLAAAAWPPSSSLRLQPSTPRTANLIGRAMPTGWTWRDRARGRSRTSGLCTLRRALQRGRPPTKSPLSRPGLPPLVHEDGRRWRCYSPCATGSSSTQPQGGRRRRVHDG